MTEQGLKEYEIAFLVKEEGEIPSLLALFKRHNVEVFFEGQVKKIALSYRIGKETQAWFVYVYARATPENLVALERDMRVTPNLLRFLILKAPAAREKKTAAPSEHMRAVAPQTSVRSSSVPLSNEELERKIDEILQ